jgi:hypothetical protein
MSIAFHTEQIQSGVDDSAGAARMVLNVLLAKQALGSVRERLVDRKDGRKRQVLRP